MASKDFSLLKEEIEKLAKNPGPAIPISNVSNGPTQHAIIRNKFSPPEGHQKGQTTSTNNVKEMQSRILDLGAIMKELGQPPLPQIGQKNIPDGGWGLKTNQALENIRDYLVSVFPLLKELKKEGLLIDDPNQGALNWFVSQVPQITKNVVPLTPAEKDDRAGEMIKALKYFASLLNQFKSLAKKGQFRGLFDGSEVVAKIPSNRPLIKAPGQEDKEDQIGSLVNSIKKNDPNAPINPAASISVPSPNGQPISIPLKALTDKEQFLSFMKSKGLDEEQAKSFFQFNIKPAAQNLKVV